MQGPRIHAILRADLQSMSDDYIQERFEVTEGQLRSIRASALYKERLADLQGRADDKAVDRVADEEDRVATELSKSALKAAQKNVALLDSENEKVQQASAWDILDRTGYPKTTRSETRQKASVTIDVEAMKALGEALTEPPLEPVSVLEEEALAE